MPSIGSYSFNTMTGTFKCHGTDYMPVTKPMVDGAMYFSGGRHSGQREFTTSVDVVVASTADPVETYALISGYATLKGTVVTVTDGTELDWNNVFVLDVEPVLIRRVGLMVGGQNDGDTGAKFLVTARWILALTDTAV